MGFNSGFKGLKFDLLCLHVWLWILLLNLHISRPGKRRKVSDVVLPIRLILLATWALDSTGNYKHNGPVKRFKSYSSNTTAPLIPIMLLLNCRNERKRKHHGLEVGAWERVQINLNTREMSFVNLNPNKFHSKFKLQNTLFVSQVDLLLGFIPSRGKVMEN